MIPQIEVIENGKPVSQERIDPNVAAFIMAAASTAQLVKIRKLEESKVPVKTIPLKYTVTDTTMRLRLSPPWISLSLINDGDGAVTIWVNDESEPAATDMIASGLSYNLDFTYPVIKTIYLKAAIGTTATVKIYGTEGKPIG